jgi:hypothetical protein
VSHGFVVATVENHYIARRNQMEQSLPIQICGLQRFTDREGVVVQLTDCFAGRE